MSTTPIFNQILNTPHLERLFTNNPQVLIKSLCNAFDTLGYNSYMKRCLLKEHFVPEPSHFEITVVCCYKYDGCSSPVDLAWKNKVYDIPYVYVNSSDEMIIDWLKNNHTFDKKLQHLFIVTKDTP